MDTAIAQLFGTKNAVQYLLALHVKPAFNKNLRVEVECKKNTNQTEFAQVDKPLPRFLREISFALQCWSRGSLTDRLSAPGRLQNCAVIHVHSVRSNNGGLMVPRQC